eukprot:7501672-Lingulodinium_polyedra.AAC.1
MTRRLRTKRLPRLTPGPAILAPVGTGPIPPEARAACRPGGVPGFGGGGCAIGPADRVAEARDRGLASRLAGRGPFSCPLSRGGVWVPIGLG